MTFSVEDMLKNNGGVSSKSSYWNRFTQQDDMLVTGWKTYSSELLDELLFEKIDWKTLTILYKSNRGLGVYSNH